MLFLFTALMLKALRNITKLMEKKTPLYFYHEHLRIYKYVYNRIYQGYV